MPGIGPSWSVTVPGAVHSWGEAHRRFGRLDWADLLAFGPHPDDEESDPGAAPLPRADGNGEDGLPGDEDRDPETPALPHVDIHGEEVAWADIVKGYEVEDGSWVVVTDDDGVAVQGELGHEGLSSPVVSTRSSGSVAASTGAGE